MSERPTLTRRQAEVLAFVRRFVDTHGYSPTLHEIGEAMGVNRVTVFEHVKSLEMKGWIRTARNLSRSIELLDEAAPEPTGLPILGRIAAGQPIEAVEDRETLHLEELFPADGQHFVLRVQGDSMIDDQIRDGDFVVCASRTTAKVGETVVALIRGEETTLKRYYPMGKTTRLEPRHPTLEPILVPTAEVQIQGVVVGVLRKY